MQVQKTIDFGKVWAFAEVGWSTRAISYEMAFNDEDFAHEVIDRISYGEIGPKEVGKRMAPEDAEKWEKRGFPVAWFTTKADGRIAIGLMRAAYEDNCFEVKEISQALGLSTDSIEYYLEIKKRKSEWD